jgi:hypothetical protein
MARRKKGEPVRHPPLKKVGPCKLCNDTGRLRVWKKDRLTGKLYSVDENCACKTYFK